MITSIELSQVIKNMINHEKWYGISSGIGSRFDLQGNEEVFEQLLFQAGIVLSIDLHAFDYASVVYFVFFLVLVMSLFLPFQFIGEVVVLGLLPDGLQIEEGHGFVVMGIGKDQVILLVRFLIDGPASYVFVGHKDTATLNGIFDRAFIFESISLRFIPMLHFRLIKFLTKGSVIRHSQVSGLLFVYEMWLGPYVSGYGIILVEIMLVGIEQDVRFIVNVLVKMMRDLKQLLFGHFFLVFDQVQPLLMTADFTHGILKYILELQIKDSFIFYKTLIKQKIKPSVRAIWNIYMILAFFLFFRGRGLSNEPSAIKIC